MKDENQWTKGDKFRVLKNHPDQDIEAGEALEYIRPVKGQRHEFKLLDGHIVWLTSEEVAATQNKTEPIQVNMSKVVIKHPNTGLFHISDNDNPQRNFGEGFDTQKDAERAIVLIASIESERDKQVN